MRTCFNHPVHLEKYDKTVRDGLSKECNVNFGVTSRTQLPLPDEMGGLGVLVRVTFSRRFSRKHSKMFHLQKRLRNG